MSPLGWHPSHIVDDTDTQYLGDQDWQQFRFFRVFFFFLSTCLSLYQSVCVSVHLFTINLEFLKTHNYWLAQLVYMTLVSGLELKNCKMPNKILKNSSKKTKWEAKLLGFGSKQPPQQQSTPFCFIGPVYSIVVLWNVCFLSLQSSLYFSAWLWTTTLEIYVRFFWTLHVVTYFLKQSDCSTFENWMFMRQDLLNFYVDIIMWLDILTTNELIKCFRLVMVRHTQLCLKQSNSKIIEILATQEKF